MDSSLIALDLTHVLCRHYLLLRFLLFEDAYIDSRGSLIAQAAAFVTLSPVLIMVRVVHNNLNAVT